MTIMFNSFAPTRPVIRSGHCRACGVHMAWYCTTPSCVVRLNDAGEAGEAFTFSDAEATVLRSQRDVVIGPEDHSALCDECLEAGEG